MSDFDTRLLKCFIIFILDGRLYNTLARPTLCYGSEAWTLRTQDISRITVREMAYQTAGYTKCDHKRNEEVLQKLKVQPIIDYIYSYQENWKCHIQWMGSGGLPKEILRYQPRGTRSIGHPMK